MSQIKQDRNFDNMAIKFDRQIYGTSKGRLRHALLVENLLPYMQEAAPGIALDAGGGTGEFAQVLLQHGFDVILNDISQDCLELAKQKLNEDFRAQYDDRAITELEFDHGFHLICCHAVLEWAADPFACIDRLLALLEPGGYLSLSFFNADANTFGNLLYGNFDLVKNKMQQKNRLRLADHTPLPPKQVLAHLEGANCGVVKKAGVRCFHDYLRDKSMQESHYQDLLEAELFYGGKEPYMWLGKYFHIVVKKHHN